LIDLLLVGGIPVNGPAQLDLGSTWAFLNQELKNIDLDHVDLHLKMAHI
jgi:hypothetical protein